MSKSAFQRISRGHPWILATDLTKKVKLPERACAYYLGDHWWLHSPKSFIRLRRLGPFQSKWMHNSKFNTLSNSDQFNAYFGEWLVVHFGAVLSEKAKFIDMANEDLCIRWIFSENDLVPGLIVDIFGEQIVCQINSAPIEIFWPKIKEALKAAYRDFTGKTGSFLELRSSSVRLKEGLEIIPTETEQERIVVKWNGFNWNMQPAGSQKTGAYLDQRDNHTFTAELAKKYHYKSAWDLCCYQGGFSVHLLNAGLSVVAVDQSAEALAIAEQNIQLNNLISQNFFSEKSDIFVWLNKKVQNNEKVDLIVLDPPSFVRSRNQINPAKKAYTELHRLALQCLNPSGMIVSCTCSHYISQSMVEEIISNAAKDTNVTYKTIAIRGPSQDHNPILNFPEGDYLHALYIRTDE